MLETNVKKLIVERLPDGNEGLRWIRTIAKCSLRQAHELAAAARPILPQNFTDGISNEKAVSLLDELVRAGGAGHIEDGGSDIDGPRVLHATASGLQGLLATPKAAKTWKFKGWGPIRFFSEA